MGTFRQGARWLSDGTATQALDTHGTTPPGAANKATNGVGKLWIEMAVNTRQQTNAPT